MFINRIEVGSKRPKMRRMRHWSETSLDSADLETPPDSDAGQTDTSGAPKRDTSGPSKRKDATSGIPRGSGRHLVSAMTSSTSGHVVPSEKRIEEPVVGDEREIAEERKDDYEEEEGDVGEREVHPDIGSSPGKFVINCVALWAERDGVMETQIMPLYVECNIICFKLHLYMTVLAHNGLLQNLMMQLILMLCRFVFAFYRYITVYLKSSFIKIIIVNNVCHLLFSSLEVFKIILNARFYFFAKLDSDSGKKMTTRGKKNRYWYLFAKQDRKGLQ